MTATTTTTPTLPSREIHRLAAKTFFNGFKLRHVKAALPDLPEADQHAIKDCLRRQRDVRAERAERRLQIDPLILAARTRRQRTPSAIAERQARQQADEAKRRREIEAHFRAIERARQARESMKAAARIARALGYDVRSSKDRSGRVSSYYVDVGERFDLRISDHELPVTQKRMSDAEFHGRRADDPYPGPEIIVDEPRSKTWLRRALILTINCRPVPGA